MPAASRLVSGLTTVAPAGAFSTPLKARPVSASVPPRTTSPALQPAGKVKAPLPLLALLTTTSPASALPLPLLSHSTNAPFR